MHIYCDIICVSIYQILVEAEKWFEVKLEAVYPSDDPNAVCLVYLTTARPGICGHPLQGTLSCFNCAFW